MRWAGHKKIIGGIVVSKEIDKLIEKILSEKINVQGLKDKIKRSPNYQPAYDNKKTDITNLAALDNIAGSIDQPDVTKAFDDDAKEKERAAALFLTKAIKQSKERRELDRFISNAVTNITNATEFKAGEIQSLDPGKIRSIAFKSLQTVSADPADSSAMGEYPEGIATALNTIFQGSDSFQSRLLKLKEVCEAAISNLGTVSRGSDPTSAIANLLVLDYVTTLVREIDSGTGAYNFEAFLAMLTGGRVTGKETNPEGKMGGADFRSRDDSAGSSKYYGRLAGITQSSQGFKLKEPVFYVIAIKKAQNGKTSDPRQITSLDIYTFFLIKLAENVNGKDYFAFKYKGGEVEVRDVESGSQINLSSGLSQRGKPLTISLVTTANQEDIRSVVEAITGRRQDSVAQTLKYFKQLSEDLYTANEKSQAYASTGDIGKGDEALKSIQSSDVSFGKLQDVIEAAKDPAQQQKPPIEESKRSLDKLIEAIIKQKLLK